MVRMAIVGPRPRLAVDHAGEGETVVLLHGIGGNRTNWSDNLPALAERFHVLAWDARGYGDSDDYDGPLDFDDVRLDLLRVLDHFAVERAHLVGLSMGGRIAADFAARHPARVRSVAFCDTHLGFAHFSESARSDFVRRRKAPLLDGKSPRDIAPAIADTLIGDKTDAPVLARLVESISRLHVESYIKTLEASVDGDHAAAFSAVRAPTLILVGSLDRLTPPEMARRILELVPHARFEIIEGAGHLANIERPTAFNRVLLDFLSSTGKLLSP